MSTAKSPMRGLIVGVGRRVEIASGRRRRSKYAAVRTTVDGITFASKKEARRYSELRLLERTGAIRLLRLQPRFTLEAAGFSGPEAYITIGEYVADFAYTDDVLGEVVEDVKGFKTPLYRWKKKHVEAQYGITVTEI